MTMKLCFAAVLTSVTLLVAAPAYAEDAATKKEPSAKQLAQREKMKGCNAEAKSQGLKGDERKTFMKSCLSGGAAGEAAPADPKAK